MPESDPATIHVLWARSDRYKRANFIAAWSDGIVDSWTELYEEQRDEAIREFLGFGDESDGPWTFWMSVHDIDRPGVVGEPVEVAVDA